jgi:hypothetical protein
VNFLLYVFLPIGGLLIAMLVASELGRRLGIRHLTRNPEGLAKGAGAAEAAVFALLGLLLAFTFSGAASRFEGRRHLITSEANAIGTAYLRIDLLPADARPGIQDLFRRYLDVRVATHHDAHDMAVVTERLAEGAALQGEIWAKAVAASLGPGAPTQASMLLLPALNEMIDITTSRVMATRNHPPLIIFLMLAALSIVGALLVGYDTSENKRRNWLHTLVFAVILVATTYVIVDLEFPRSGFIRVDASDQILIELRESMN